MACPLPASTPDIGALTATKSQMCNVPGSQGALHGTVTAVGGAGQPLSATLSNITLGEVNSTSHAPVASGCTASLASTQVSGTLVLVSGGGGGGGSGACPATVGD